MTVSEKVDTDWRGEPLEQLLLLITSEPLQPEMLALIDLPMLLRQLQPAIDVLHFGGTVVGPQEVAVLYASGCVSQHWLESIVPTQADPQAFAWAQAELARRKAGG